MAWFTPEETEATWLSLKVATVAVAASLPFGIALGRWLARGRSRLRAVVDATLQLPLVLPPIVTGYLLLEAFGRRGPIGSFLESAFGVRVVFHWTGAALAAAVVSFPLMVRATRLAFLAVDPKLEDAARTLGARRLDVFASVALPLAARGIVAGAVLAFARAVGEFGATIVIAGNIRGETRTIPLRLWTDLTAGGDPSTSWRLVLASIAIAIAALAIGAWLERRSEGKLR